MVIFSLLSGISRPGSIKIERSLKKYPMGLIFKFFGQLGGPNSPRQPWDLGPGPWALVFDILTSKKYGVDDPSGISHFCLSSKWHFFVIFYQFLPKNGFGGFLTSKKYGGNVPSGISHFCLSSKWHFFVIFYQFLPKNGFLLI